MTTGRISMRIFFAMAALATACTVSKTPAPPLSGPSTLGLSLEITANPDVISFDGASQSQITILAFDSNGQPKANQQLRAEIVANGKLVDFGALSARTMVTGSNGRASVTYTAPNPTGSTIPTLSISITPGGTNSANAVPRFVDIRLVPPGVITGGGPTAKFTFGPAAPTAFNDVFFDASTSTTPVGSITSYAWNFGDGSSATGVSPTHRFAGASTYHVVLTVTDNNGLTGSTSTDVPVTASAGLKADFTFSPAAPATGQTINFNGGLSTAGAGRSIVSWSWDFGSGLTGSGITVTTSYAAAGTYSVTLTIRDDAGQTAHATQPVTVASTAGGGLAAEFGFSPSSPSVGQIVFFNAAPSTTGAGTTIAAYTWDFGDGSSGTTATPSHTFGAAATYTVRLTITNSSGQTATVTHPVPVTVGSVALTAGFTASPSSAVSGQLVNFNANTSSPLSSINQFDWDFGDGTRQTVNGVNNTTINHAYTTFVDTTFVVRLTVHDASGNTATTTNNVSVKAGTAPQAFFTIAPSPAKVGNPVTFDGAPSTGGVTRYTWDFGDSSPIVSTLAPTTAISHTYAVANTYTITLTVTNGSGQTGSTSHTLLVQP